MAVQNITHNTAGALTINAASGSEAFVTVNANVTALSVTNLPNGEVLTAVFELGATTSYTVNFAGFGTFNNWSNPGAVTIAPSNPVLGVFVQHDSGVRMTTPSVIGAGGGSGGGGGGGGLPAGGTEEQELVKQSTADGDAVWQHVTTLRRGVSPHHYGPGVGQGNAAEDDAAFAWLRTNHPNQPWYLRADTTYTTTAPIDISGNDGAAVIGGGAKSTVINCTNTAVPAIRVGGENQTVRDASITYNNFGTGQPETAACIRTADSMVFALSRIQDMYLHSCGRGFYAPVGLAFNNVFDNVRVSNFTEIGVEFRNLGTGSVMNNLYFHSSTSQNPGSNVGLACKNALKIEGNQATIEINQLNVEYMQCSSHPILINAGGVTVINSLWCEALQWPSHGEIVRAFGNTHITINGFENIYAFPLAATDPAETQAIFGTGGGASITVLGPVRLRDNGANTLYLTRAADGDVNNRFYIDRVSDGGTVTGLANHTAGPSDLQGIVPQQTWAQPTADNFQYAFFEWDAHGPVMSGPTASRPTSTRPGQDWYDETLNRPIRRNAGNTGWVFSDGTAA